MGLLKKIFGNYSEKEIKRIIPIQQQVLALETKYSAVSDDELKGMTESFKAQLKDGKPLDAILPDAFAVCREAAWRVLSMKHFPVQILESAKKSPIFSSLPKTILAQKYLKPGFLTIPPWLLIPPTRQALKPLEFMINSITVRKK